jgi:hypothetical protein
MDNWPLGPQGRLQHEAGQEWIIKASPWRKLAEGVARRVSDAWLVQVIGLPLGSSKNFQFSTFS